MAIYSCSVKTVSRSGGRSATAAAAYRNAEQIIDQRTGEVHDYERRSGVDDVVAFAPEGMEPPKSAELWNAAEQAETRSNSTVAREVLVALPHELDKDQRKELTERISGRLSDRYGVAGTAAIHQPDAEGDNRNHHAHILMTTRRMDPATGELGEKTRELDAKATGAGEVKWIRAMVAGETNAALARAGLDERVDHRSLEDQRAAALEAGDHLAAGELDRMPTVHEGPTVTAIRRRGGSAQVAQINDARREANAERTSAGAELQRLDAQIYDLEKARDARAAAVAEEQARQDTQQRQRDQLAEASRQVRDLEQSRRQPEPPAMATARQEAAAARAAQVQAAEWHQQHPIRSGLCKWLGITPAVDQRAQAVTEAAERSPARKEALQWREWLGKQGEALQEARERLNCTDGVQAARETIKQAAERLQAAQKTMLDDVKDFERERQMHVYTLAEQRMAELRAQYRTPDPNSLPELLTNTNSLSSSAEQRHEERKSERAEQAARDEQRHRLHHGEAQERPSQSNQSGPRLGR